MLVNKSSKLYNKLINEAMTRQKMTQICIQHITKNNLLLLNKLLEP